jgi:predicted O-methyltransferase YrrM
MTNTTLEKNFIYNSFINNTPKVVILEDMELIRQEIQQFIENTKPYQEKIRLIHQESFSALQNLISMNQKFDFIYIDGCHEAINVLEDAVLSFKMLKQNGIMIFDDYNWINNKEFHEIPRMGINSFMTTYSHYIKIVYVGDQLVITKL